MGYLIETERLGLRELVIEDARDVASYLLDRESMKYYDQEFHPGDEAAWISKNIARYMKDGFGLWAVIRKEDGAFVGDCGITMQNIDGKLLPEVGFHTVPSLRRKGYAAEAAAASVKHIARLRRFPAVYSYCRKDNAPSRGVMRKIGMRFLKEYSIGPRSHVVYSIDTWRFADSD